MNPLARWLARAGLTQTEFGARIGVDQGDVSRYVRWGTGAPGTRAPGRWIRQAIEQATGGAVSAKSWDRPSRKKAA